MPFDFDAYAETLVSALSARRDEQWTIRRAEQRPNPTVFFDGPDGLRFRLTYDKTFDKALEVFLSYRDTGYGDLEKYGRFYSRWSCNGYSCSTEDPVSSMLVGLDVLLPQFRTVIGKAVKNRDTAAARTAAITARTDLYTSAFPGPGVADGQVIRWGAGAVQASVETNAQTLDDRLRADVLRVEINPTQIDTARAAELFGQFLTSLAALQK